MVALHQHEATAFAYGQRLAKAEGAIRAAHSQAAGGGVKGSDQASEKGRRWN
jgi:hypothetical protein